MTMRFFVFAFTLSAICVSCNRIKSEGESIANKAQQKVSEKTEEMSDEIIPHFDAYKPDTKFNKLRFRDFLQVELTPDIKNLYCHDDAMGIDADYQFGFNCNKKTAEKIKKKLHLQIDQVTEDWAFGLQDDFDWWDKKKIEKLQLYSWTNGDQYFKYFWYDEKEQKAYYFDFDM